MYTYTDTASRPHAYIYRYRHRNRWIYTWGKRTFKNNSNQDPYVFVCQLRVVQYVAQKKKNAQHKCCAKMRKIYRHVDVRLCLYMYTYLYTCIHMCICIHMYTCISPDVYAYICMYLYDRCYTSCHMYIYIYIFASYLYIYTRVAIFLFEYIHIYDAVPVHVSNCIVYVFKCIHIYTIYIQYIYVFKYTFDTIYHTCHRFYYCLSTPLTRANTHVRARVSGVDRQ